MGNLTTVRRLKYVLLVLLILGLIGAVLLPVFARAREKAAGYAPPSVLEQYAPVSVYVVAMICMLAAYLWLRAREVHLTVTVGGAKVDIGAEKEEGQ